jgi:hypothetical protein
MRFTGNLSERPWVFMKAVDILSRRGEFGEKRTPEQMKAVAGLYVNIGNKSYGRTNSNGELLFKPDTTGNLKINVADSLENYCSKWLFMNLVAGARDTLKDPNAEAVFMYEKFIDEHGKEWLSALWNIGGYENLAYRNFVHVTFPDSILKKGVWVDPKYKDGKHNNSLSDINQQIAKYHLYGLPKLFESDTSHSYCYIHYGGTAADGQTTRTYRQNEQGVMYKSRTDIYYKAGRADQDEPGVAYALLEHEWDRVFFAYLEFAEKYYVMYKDPISRVFRDGYSPENIALEDKIGALALALTDLYFYNNYLLTSTIEFPGYTGTKNASIINQSNRSDYNGLKNAEIKLNKMSMKQLEQMFSSADEIKAGTDKEGPFVVTTEYHKY